MVINTYNPISTWEAEVGELKFGGSLEYMLSSRLSSLPSQMSQKQN